MSDETKQQPESPPAMPAPTAPLWNLPLEVRLNKLGAAIHDASGYHICNIYRPHAKLEAQAIVDAVNHTRVLP